MPTSTIDTNIQKQFNLSDETGLKQGVWKTYSGKKLVKLETYKNGKLNGLVEEWKNGYHDISYYKNNIIDSLLLTYKLDSTLCDFVIYFRNGKKEWLGFPTVLHHLAIPIKPFMIYKDSIFISIPYMNGQTFYSGAFIKHKLTDEGIPTGRHIMYYKNGKTKILYDYDTDQMKIFDNRGRIFKEGKITHLDVSSEKELLE